MRPLIMILCSLCVLPVVLWAAPIDTSTPLLCATQRVQECGSDMMECQQRSLKDVNLPPFLKIDLGQKKVVAMGAEPREAVVRSIEMSEEIVVIQGGQPKVGWSLVLNRNTGSMSATVVSDGVGFVMAGGCIPLSP
jgi:hypothetical protein